MLHTTAAADSSLFQMLFFLSDSGWIFFHCVSKFFFGFFFVIRASCVCMCARFFHHRHLSLAFGLRFAITTAPAAVCIKDLTSMRLAPYQYICLCSLFLYFIILFSTLLCETHANTIHTETRAYTHKRFWNSRKAHNFGLFTTSNCVPFCYIKGILCLSQLILAFRVIYR